MNKTLATKSDIIEIAGKTALSAIPIGGTLVTCVWDAIKANCAQNRLNEWKALIEEKLSLLEITLDEISNNEQFTSAIMKATDSAIKTMENEKRKYLADAVTNSITCNLNESVLMMYFDLIDRYTLWHLKILNYFSNPAQYPNISIDKYYMGSPMQPLIETFPELATNKELVNKIVKDLYLDGLMNTQNLNCTMTSSGMIASRTTALGNDFISFITQSK